MSTPKSKRPENARMQAFLAANGIEATPKYIPDGSLKGCWRIYNATQEWNLDLAAKLNALGFTDFDGKPLGEFSGNGGMFSVFVRGHNELLSEPEFFVAEEVGLGAQTTGSMPASWPPLNQSNTPQNSIVLVAARKCREN